MKKNILFLLLIPFFFACSSDDKNEETQWNNVDYLVNTKWETEKDYPVYMSMEFTKAGATFTKPDITIKYNYKEEGKRVRLYPIDNNDDELLCQIYKETSLIIMGDIGEAKFIFTKK